MPQNSTIDTLRSVGPLAHLVILLRVQIFAAGLTCLFLSDALIEDVGREELRDAVYLWAHAGSLAGLGWIKLPLTGLALAVLTGVLRASGELTIKLVSPGLTTDTGVTGILSRWLPRLIAMAPGLVLTGQLLGVSLHPYLLAATDASSQSTALIFALIFLVTTLGFSLVRLASLDARSTGTGGETSALLWLMLLSLPALAALSMSAAILGFWGSSGIGVSVESFVQGNDGWLGLVLAAAALFLAALTTRVAVECVGELLWPETPVPVRLGRSVTHLIARLLPVAMSSLLVLEIADQPSGVHLVRAMIAVGILSLVGLGVAWLPYAARAQDQTPALVRRLASGWAEAVHRIERLPLLTQDLIALALALAVTFVTATFNVYYFTKLVPIFTLMGALSIILIWGAIVTVVLSPLAFASHLMRFAALLLLFIAAIAFSLLDLNDNHRIRGVANGEPSSSRERASVMRDLSPESSTYYIVRKGALEDWLSSRPDLLEYEHYPVFLVATEGGGIRAAYYTATVLSAIQDMCPAFAQHVFVISGVSGGSVGAAVFSALTASQSKGQHAGKRPSTGCDFMGKHIRDPARLAARARRILSSDMLSPLLGATLFPDVVQRFLPVANEHVDRARALEFALEGAWERDCSPPGCDASLMKSPAAKLYAGLNRAVAVPSLILNTTRVENGTNNPYVFGPISRKWPEFVAGVSGQPSRVWQIPLSTAAIVSARFPYLTPAARGADSDASEGAQPSRFVDGGYFESSGTYAIRNVLSRAFTEKVLAAGSASALARVHFIVLVLKSTPCEGEKDGCEAESDALQGMDEVLSPVRTLLRTRSSRAAISEEDLDQFKNFVGLMCQSWLEETSNPSAAKQREAAYVNPCRESATGFIDNGYPISSAKLRFRTAQKYQVPLSWHLSHQARAAIDGTIDELTGKNNWQTSSDGWRTESQNRTFQADNDASFEHFDRNSWTPFIEGEIEQIVCALHFGRSSSGEIPQNNPCVKLQR